MPFFHHLLYTRTLSFDYRWVIGLDDPVAAADIEQAINSWFNARQLDDRLSFSAFLVFRDYGLLIDARRSRIRPRDKNGRDIVERLVLAWKMSEKTSQSLMYRHLSGLLSYLRSQSDFLLKGLPDDDPRPPKNTLPQPRMIEVSPEMLESRTDQSETDFRARGLPIEQPEWALGGVVVEVPRTLTFREMTLRLQGRISEKSPICIMNGLSYKDRPFSEAGIGWLTSTDELEEPSDFLIRDRLGQKTDLHSIEVLRGSSHSASITGTPDPSVTPQRTKNPGFIGRLFLERQGLQDDDLLTRVAAARDATREAAARETAARETAAREAAARETAARGAAAREVAAREAAARDVAVREAVAREAAAREAAAREAGLIRRLRAADEDREIRDLVVSLLSQIAQIPISKELSFLWNGLFFEILHVWPPTDVEISRMWNRRAQSLITLTLGRGKDVFLPSWTRMFEEKIRRLEEILDGYIVVPLRTLP